MIADAQAQMSQDSVRFEDVLTQLEEKRQALEKREQEADRLYRQREEDARKAREFRSRCSGPRKTPAAGGEAEAKAHPAGRPLRFGRCVCGAGKDAEGAGKKRNAPSTPTRRGQSCAAN